MTDKQLKTLDFIKTHFNVEIEKIHGDRFYTIYNNRKTCGNIFKNGNFKFDFNRYAFNKDGDFYQIVTWRA